MNDPSHLIYCIDASAFIDLIHFNQPSNYPGVWDSIAELADNGRLIMYEEVKEECKDPAIQPWLKDHNAIVRPFSLEINQSMLELQSDLDRDGQWMVDPNSNKDKADPWVVAHAMAEDKREPDLFVAGLVKVVSHERITNKKKGKVKIPDVCKRYNIECITFPELVRLEGWVFVRR